MARVCKTCCHPEIKAINAAIVGKTPLTRIASKFDVHYKSIEWHAKKHVKPTINQLNEALQAKAVKSLVEMRLRSEVHLAPLEKCKWMQDKIANALDDVVFNTADRVALMRELRGWFDIENKLCGNYQQERANERDAELNRLVDQIRVAAEENGTTYEEERDIFLKHYAGKLGVKPDIQDRLANDESPLIG